MTDPWPELRNALVPTSVETELGEIERSPRDDQLAMLMELQNSYREGALAGDVKAADVILKISDRLAKLLGWDTAAKLDVNHRVGSGPLL